MFGRFRIGMSWVQFEFCYITAIKCWIKCNQGRWIKCNQGRSIGAHFVKFSCIVGVNTIILSVGKSYKYHLFPIFPISCHYFLLFFLHLIPNFHLFPLHFISSHLLKPRRTTNHFFSTLSIPLTIYH